MSYRTEIYVADDRYVCLQLPDFLPAGARATVTVTFDRPEHESAEGFDDEPDSGEIDWWDRPADPADRR